MIVLSGVLVLVALVLLVVGIVGPLGAVYGSIVASLAAAVLLAVAVYSRRGAPARPETAGQVEPEPATGQTWLRDLSGDAQDRDRLQPPVAPVPPAQVAPPEPPPVPVAAPVPVEPVQESRSDIDRIIWVIDERPLYHRQGCVHLSDGEPIPLDVEEAREDGFVPCPVCRPDEVDRAGENDEDDGRFDDDDEVAPVIQPAAPAVDARSGSVSAPAEPARRLGGSVPVGGDAAIPVVTAPPVAAVPVVAPPPAREQPAAREQPPVREQPLVREEPAARELPAEAAVRDLPGTRPDRVEDPDGTAARESAKAAERERIRVALPAPAPPEEPPAGLVGRLLRRRR